MDPSKRLKLGISLSSIIIILGFVMSQVYPKDPYPYLDALNSVLGCTGTLLMAFRWYESVVLFTVSNLICGMTYFMLQKYTVWMTMMVYFMSSSMCVYTWDRQYMLQQYNNPDSYHDLKAMNEQDIELQVIKSEP